MVHTLIVFVLICSGSYLSISKFTTSEYFQSISYAPLKAKMSYLWVWVATYNQVTNTISTSFSILICSKLDDSYPIQLFLSFCLVSRFLAKPLVSKYTVHFLFVSFIRTLILPAQLRTLCYLVCPADHLFFYILEFWIFSFFL